MAMTKTGVTITPAMEAYAKSMGIPLDRLGAATNAGNGAESGSQSGVFQPGDPATAMFLWDAANPHAGYARSFSVDGSTDLGVGSRYDDGGGATFGNMLKDVTSDPGALMLMAGLGGALGAFGGAAGGGANGLSLMEGAYPESLGFGEAAGATGAAGSASPFVFNPAVDSQLASSQLGLTAADMAGAVSPAVAYGLPEAGGLLTTAAEAAAPTTVKSAIEKAAAAAGGSGLLGAAATGLGALAGSQGQQANQSSVRDIPDWLKPYANQSLNAASGLLAQQTAPGAMQGYQDMQRVGQGLLATPQMGNGFNRFFPGR